MFVFVHAMQGSCNFSHNSEGALLAAVVTKVMVDDVGLTVLPCTYSLPFRIFYPLLASLSNPNLAKGFNWGCNEWRKWASVH